MDLLMTATLAPPTNLCLCGNPKQRADWIACLACLTKIDEQGMADLRQQRDEIADWLPAADKVLQAMDRADPRYISGLETWKKRLRLYEALCLISPEML
jgi:hypothetical protein